MDLEPALVEVEAAGVGADKVAADRAGWVGCAPVPDKVVSAYALPVARPSPINRETPASNKNAPSAEAR